jgi:hypothetical protein
MKQILLLVILAVALPVVAQKPTPTPPDTPKLTEHQQDRLDLCVAKVNEIQTRYESAKQLEMQPWSVEANGIIEAVQKANPDFVWHAAQSPQDHSGWMHKPPPAPPTPAPAQPAATPEAPKK